MFEFTRAHGHRLSMTWCCLSILKESTKRKMTQNVYLHRRKSKRHTEEVTKATEAKATCRGNYDLHTPRQKAQIGQYATENSPTKLQLILVHCSLHTNFSPTKYGVLSLCIHECTAHSRTLPPPMSVVSRDLSIIELTRQTKCLPIFVSSQIPKLNARQMHHTYSSKFSYVAKVGGSGLPKFSIFTIGITRV